MYTYCTCMHFAEDNLLPGNAGKFCVRTIGCKAVNNFQQLTSSLLFYTALSCQHAKQFPVLSNKLPYCTYMYGHFIFSFGYFTINKYWFNCDNAYSGNSIPQFIFMFSALMLFGNPRYFLPPLQS